MKNLNNLSHQSIGPLEASTREKCLFHLFHMLSHYKHCCLLILRTSHWLKWKSADVEGHGGRSERRKRRIRTWESWLIDVLWWGKMGVLDRTASDHHRCWMGWVFDQQAWYWGGEVVMSCIAWGRGGWWYWKQGDWHPIGPKAWCGGSPRLYPVSN